MLLNELEDFKKGLESLKARKGGNNNSSECDDILLYEPEILKDKEYLDVAIFFAAYRSGFFPMFHNEGVNEVLWHNPPHRAIFDLTNPPKMPKSVKKSAEKFGYEVKFDTNFECVIKNCANRTTTWLIKQMADIYIELYYLGFAHCVEVYSANQLVGGLYGVSIGCAFFGESMFHKKTDASKFAFYKLVDRLLEKKFTLLDSQYLNDFTQSLGAFEISEEEFHKKLKDAISRPAFFCERERIS